MSQPQVTLKVVGPGNQLTPSYLDATVGGNIYLSGLYDGYCIKTSLPIANNTPYTADVYSSYELSLLPTNLLTPSSANNLDLVNWIINQNFTSNGYTFGEVQTAIWTLLGQSFNPNGGDLGTWSQTKTNQIIQLAQANGENFTPSASEYISVILTPFTSTGQAAQPIIIDVKAAELGDFVWQDNNANGIQDNGESGISGTTVNLVRDINSNNFIDSNEILATTTTDANGFYSFKGLTPGLTYQVQFTTPTGFDAVSAPQQGGDTSKDSDGLLSNAVILNPGEKNLTIDSGFYKYAKIGDFVFNDLNANGVQDSGENGIGGVTVQLINPVNGNVIASTTTNANGGYLFDGLTPGDYQVKFTAPTGYNFTTPDAGADDAKDSDANPTTGLTQSVTLTSGQFNGTLDAGLVAIPLASLGDFVWHDLDADGIQDANEPGIAGASVKLVNPTTNAVIATTTTDGAGKYNFTGLTPGDYKVEFVKPNGFSQSSPANLGGDDSKDSDGTSVTTNLSPGENDPTIDSGFYNPASLGDYVFVDNNNNGVQDAGDTALGGVKVELVQNAVLIATQNTNPDGSYLFDGLTPGDYQVKFTAPSGYSFTTPDAGADDTKDSDANPTTGLTQTVTLKSGDNNTTLDAGLVELTPNIDIEKFVNGIDVTNINNLPQIAAGQNVTFTYTVKNTGNVNFLKSEIIVKDDHGTVGNTSDDFTPTLILSSDVGSDNILSVGETWTYTSPTFAAQNLSTTSSPKDLEYVFTGSSSTTGTYGNIRTFTQSGVSVDVSAFSRKNGYWKTAYVGAYDGGLGVTNKDESGSYHRVDNSGGVDYLLFEFGQDITVDKAFLDYVEHDSDISIWIGDRNGANISSLSDTLLSSFVKENNLTNSSYDRWADFNAGKLTGDTLIISAHTDGTNDSFKLKKLDLSVPGEQTIGVYKNTVTATAGSIGDSDISGYTNPTNTGTPPDCIETTLTFTGNTPLDGTDGNVRTFSKDGLSVDVRGFSRGKDQLTGQWKNAYLGVYSSGLGVTDQHEATDAHRVDNLGNNFNYVMFKFSKEVEVDRAYLNAVVDDSDAKFWIGNTTQTSLSDSLLNSFYSEINETPGIGDSAPRWADINSGELSGNTLVIAANPNEPTFEDSFKINQLDVCYF